MAVGATLDTNELQSLWDMVGGNGGELRDEIAPTWVCGK
jgi:hypothetical protein